jgi:tetratricopeptide (TPR) repeat protein
MSKHELTIIERAEILYSMGQCDQAVNMLTQAIEANSVGHEAHAKLAELLIDSERYGDALQVLHKAECDPVDIDCIYLSGICHEALGDVPSAQKSADKLLEVDDQNAYGFVIKGRIAARSGDAILAETCFQDALCRNPRCGEAYLGLGFLGREAGNHATSLDWFEKAFQSCPFSRAITLAFHEAFLALNSLQRAEEAFRQALLCQSLNRRVRFLLIDVLLRQGKFGKAMPEIESAMVDFGIDSGILAGALNIRQRIGALRCAGSAGTRGTVSLCMIVKNEEKHLARCLHSVKPVVDEIVIVDTGSTDRTKDIGVAFGAHVADFPWVDDFSKARNFALSQASGDWILSLDADEIISARDHDKFRNIIDSAQTGPAAFCIRTRNYTRHVNAVGWQPNTGEYPEEEGPGWIPSDKVRLFTNDARIRFSHPVHELVEPALRKLKIAVSTCDIPVHHYGKLQEGQTHEKTRVYSNLSRKKLKKTHRDSVALRELAIQSSQLGRHEEALNLWKELLKRQPQSAEAHLNIGTACWNLAHYAEAADFADKALRLDPTLKEARFNRAIALLLVGKAEETKSILQEVVAQHPEYPAAHFLLCVAHACLEEQSEIESALDTLIPLAMEEYIGESFLDIARRFLSASLADYARLTLEAALRLGYVNSEIVSLLESCRSAAA